MIAIQIQDLPETRWKNGGGLTGELSFGPRGADIESFHWRLTLASISPGDFSLSFFKGVDRKTIVTGPGMRMANRGASRSDFQAVEPFSPLSLDGEQALDATLDGSEIQAFNLMVRRGFASGEISVHRQSTILARQGREMVFYCFAGHAEVEADGRRSRMAAGQVLTVSAHGSGECVLTCPGADALVLVAMIEHHGAPKE